MKPQDIIVMLKILLWDDSDWNIAKIAVSICLSSSETHSAIKRCEKSGLYSPVTRKPIGANLLEFILHGLKYTFPAEPGPVDRGIPTAHSARPLSNIIVNNSDEIYIWAYDKGNQRGITIPPLYPSVPEAVMKDEKLYEILSLIDALRIGRVREKKIAIDELQKRISGYK